MNYYVYVLLDKSGKFYIGYTTDLDRRISEHKRGKVHTTKRYKLTDLVLSEKFISEKDARRRERYLKSSKGRRTLRLMLKDTLRE